MAELHPAQEVIQAIILLEDRASRGRSWTQSGASIPSHAKRQLRPGQRHGPRVRPLAFTASRRLPGKARSQKQSADKAELLALKLPQGRRFPSWSCPSAVSERVPTILGTAEGVPWESSSITISLIARSVLRIPTTSETLNPGTARRIPRLRPRRGAPRLVMAGRDYL